MQTRQYIIVRRRGTILTMLRVYTRITGKVRFLCITKQGIPFKIKFAISANLFQDLFRLQSKSKLITKTTFFRWRHTQVIPERKLSLRSENHSSIWLGKTISSSTGYSSKSDFDAISLLFLFMNAMCVCLTLKKEQCCDSNFHADKQRQLN